MAGMAIKLNDLDTQSDHLQQFNIIRLEGLDCADCAAKLEKRIQAMPGVNSARVNYGAAKMEVNHQAPVGEVIEMIEKMGYHGRLDGDTVSSRTALPFWRSNKYALSTLMAGTMLVLAVLSQLLGAPSLWTHMLYLSGILLGGFLPAKAGLSILINALELDFLLEDRDELPLFPDWAVISVPGHTSHDLVLYNAQASLLYVADCFLEVKGKFRLPLPVMFPEQLHSSYAKMAALNVSSILLAHGQARYDDIPADFFQSLQNLLQERPNKLTHQIKCLSIYSPEWWRQSLLQRKAKRHNRKTSNAS